MTDLEPAATAAERAGWATLMRPLLRVYPNAEAEGIALLAAVGGGYARDLEHAPRALLIDVAEAVLAERQPATV